MEPVSSDLDKIQAVLRDKQGLIWSRAELLRWYNDAYQVLLNGSLGAKRITIIDVPPRYTGAMTHEWEDQHLWPGTLDKFTYTALQGQYQCTMQWEVPFLNGVTPEASGPGHSQQWERAFFSGTTDQHYTFALPKTTDFIKRVAWDDKRLLPLSVRELDMTASKWYERPGTPRYLTSGLGRVQTFEMFEVTATEGQGYRAIPGNGGMARQLSGDRSYTATIESNQVENAWAYMSQGDSQALTLGQTLNDWTYAVSNSWEAALVPAGTAYVWTVEQPGSGSGVTSYPWEQEFVGGNYINEATTYFNTVLADGPYAYWRVRDGSCYDFSSNNFTAIWNGRNFKDTQSLLTDPSPMVVLPADPGPTFLYKAHAKTPVITWPDVTETPFSIELWFSTPTAGQHTLWCDFAAGPGLGRLLLVSNTIVYTESGAGSATGTTNVFGNGTHHVVITHDTANTVTVYLDGVVDVSTTITPISKTPNLVSLGGRPVTEDQFFEGTLGEVAFYKKVLTATQISNHYSVGRSVYPAQPSNATQGRRGTFWWEGQNNYCQSLPADKKISITGLGYRLCPFQSTTGSQDAFCMFEWERQTIDGTTVTAAARQAYAFRWEERLDAVTNPIILSLGNPRTVSSPDRQYLGVSTSHAGFQGIGRDWHTSPNNVTVLHSLTQDRDLLEHDGPDLIPPQLRKYLRRYVLSKAYGRTGEGYQPKLSLYYAAWFDTGVKLFTTVSDLTRHDRVWRRDDTSMRSGRMPRVRLPSTFEQTWF